MTKEELQKLLRDNADIFLVDIREGDEFDASSVHIEGAKNIPMGSVFVKAGQGELPMDKKIITICQSGGRCKVLVDALKPKGFDIDYLEGGVLGWE